MRLDEATRPYQFALRTDYLAALLRAATGLVLMGVALRTRRPGGLPGQTRGSDAIFVRAFYARHGGTAPEPHWLRATRWLPPCLYLRSARRWWRPSGSSGRESFSLFFWGDLYMSHGQNTRRPLYPGGVRFCITHAKTMENDKVSPKNDNP